MSTAAARLNPRTSALLLMDFQTAVVGMLPDDAAPLLERTSQLADASRRAGIRVLYVTVGFRAGYPEVSPLNVGFAAVRQSGRMAEGAAGTEIHRAVAPRPGEAIVVKRRVGALVGTDLEVILRANGLDTLVLAGIATSGVVLSTLRHAADLDYRLVVAEDACADRDAEVHRVLCEKVFPRQATIAKVDDIVRGLDGATWADDAGGDAVALFQVGDQQPVPIAHLERVNPGMSTADRAAITSLSPGKSVTLSQDGATVRVRRTR